MTTELPESSNAQSSGDDAHRRTSAIALELKRHLAKPGPESLVAVAAAHTELRAMSDTAATVERVACLLDVAQYFYISGQTILGLEPASSAVGVARILGAAPTLRRALTFQGALLADTGNIPGAIEACAEALELSIKQNDRMGEGGTWNNLGVAFLYAAQFSDAMSCFSRVLDAAGWSLRLLPSVL
jgi:tetratricopeptide (TPR) repeat protein